MSQRRAGAASALRLATASLVAACALSGGCAAAPSVQSGELPAGGPPAALESATISGIYAEPIQLARGRYMGEPFVAGAASRPTLTLLRDSIASADLDADGEPEWLIVLAESSGGSGTFYYLVVLWRHGAGFRSRATERIGDRVRVERVSAEGPIVRVDLWEVGDAGPACCPDRYRTKRWQWFEARLHPVARYAGQLVYGHESREFIGCDGQRYWVADASGGELRETYETLILEPYRPLFVELSASRLPAPEAAFASGYDEQLRVTALDRAELEGPGCALELAGARFRAFGVEPFWHVDLRSDALLFSRLGQAPLSFPIEEREFGGSTRVWRGRAEAGALVLTLTEQRCADPMSGSIFAYAATASVAGQTLSGCALAPLPDPREPPTATR